MPLNEFSLRVVVLDGGYDSYEVETQLLKEAGYRLELFPGERHDVAGKLAFAQGAVGAFVRWTELGAAELDRIPSIRYLVRYGIGYDNIDIPMATARGIRVCNVQGYANHAVSDHALALIFACARALNLGPGQLRANYAAPPRDHLPEIKDLTIGIVGLGRIGGTLCGKARWLFRQVIACDPYIASERFEVLGATAAPFEQLLAESDVISIHCNLTDETRCMFNAKTFGQLRHGSILVNTARGPIVDEDALLAALNSERLYAAGLDVFWDEPPLANRDELLAHPHLIATGHYAWFSTAASRELQRRAAENMVALLDEKTPEDCLNA